MLRVCQGDEVRYLTLRPSASGQRFCGLFRKPATTLHRSPIDWILVTHHHRLVLVAGWDRTVDKELASSPVRRVEYLLYVWAYSISRISLMNLLSGFQSLHKWTKEGAKR